jgi:hypothetical protein
MVFISGFVNSEVRKSEHLFGPLDGLHDKNK